MCLYLDGALVGVAAIKHPTTRHRNDVFASAGVSKEAPTFTLELGWVFIPEEHRQKGILSRRKCGCNDSR